jgi:hypothetical protein
MLQPQSVHAGTSTLPCRSEARKVAVGFYTRLVNEGFTPTQIFDLSLRLLDHVAEEKRADPDVAGSVAAK